MSEKELSDYLNRYLFINLDSTLEEYISRFTMIKNLESHQ